MNYTQDFKQIISNKNNISSTKLFVLKNSNPQKIKILPKEISNAIIDEYFIALDFLTKDKEFVDYIPDSIEKATLQVLPTDRIDLWTNILEARNCLSMINNNEITVDDYNVDGNTILIEIAYNDDTKNYFLTRYQKVASWYRNSIRFKKQNGKFVQEKGEVLALTPYVDVVISGTRCYIVNENNFNKIFKYDEVIENQVETHKEEISSLKFIGDSSSFMTLLSESKREKNAMAKVIMQKRLDKIKQYKPDYIRRQIEDQHQLSFIKFNADDTIIVDNKSFKAIMGILKGSINLDLITKELNGLVEYE